MILYMKEPKHLVMKNIILLDDPSTGGVVYISLETYKQCLLLADRFNYSPSLLDDTIRKDGQQANEQRLKCMKKFKDNAPEPLNILSPFLRLITTATNEFFEDAEIESIYGWFHVMSQVMDFNTLTKVPKEVRASINLPMVVLNSYKESWNTLTESLKDIIVPVDNFAKNGLMMQAPMQQYIPMPGQIPVVMPSSILPGSIESVNTAAEEEVNLDGDDIEVDEDYFANLMRKIEEESEKEREENKREEKKEERTPEKVEKAVESKGALIANEKEEALKVLDEFSSFN